MDYAGPAQWMPFANLAAELPWRKASDARTVQPGARAGDNAADARQSRDPRESAAIARDITAMREERARRELPAGPSPAFQVSLLERHQDIRAVIARIEAARSRTREAEALRVDARAEHCAGEAGDDALEAAATRATAPPDSLRPRDGRRPPATAAVAASGAPVDRAV